MGKSALKGKKPTPLKRSRLTGTALDDRTVRLTRNSADITSAVLNGDNTKLYYMLRHAGGNELWERDLREGQGKNGQENGGWKRVFRPFQRMEKHSFFKSGSSLSHADVSSPGKEQADFARSSHGAQTGSRDGNTCLSTHGARSMTNFTTRLSTESTGKQ